MRRGTTWLIGGLGLVAVLTTGWLVLAQAPNNPNTVGGIPSPPAPNWQLSQAALNTQPPPAPVNIQSLPPPPPPPAKTNGDLVQELIQIINETRSVDTFFVTTKLLEEMGGKSRVAVPAIIRNAERLELFKDAFLQTEKDGDKQKRVELASLIVDSLGKIMNGPPGGITARPPQAAPTPRPQPNETLIRPTSGPSNRPPVVENTPAPPPPALAPPKG